MKNIFAAVHYGTILPNIQLPLMTTFTTTFSLQGCLVQVGNGIELDTVCSPVHTLPVAHLWCDLGLWSRTVVPEQS